MSYILHLFKVRPGEERMSALLVGLMLNSAAGDAIGGIAIEALFFARFGVEFLPVMYVILGVLSFVTSMAITVMIGRIPRQRLFVILPFVVAFILVIVWLIIPLNLKWLFALMWLGKGVISSLLGLLTWGLASAACDTRQAKRLFPLFSAGAILGTVLGGLATKPLADWLHSENLLLFWAGAILITFVLGRLLIKRTALQSSTSRSRLKKHSVMQEIQRGYTFVRRSTIMQWVSYSAVLFSVCYFSLALPFSRGAAAQYPDADQLAGFLGIFQSLNTAAALLASLFLANRLFARFGIVPMLLGYSAVYLLGFAILAVSAPFMLLVSVRFVQMAWMEGIASPAWQALFNVVPTDQRDQVRAFIGGVPQQAGTFIAGLVLLVGDQALQPQQLYVIGLAVAVGLVYIIWRAGRAYGGSLVEALQAGQPHLFYSDEEPFGGFRTDAAAVSSAVRGLDDPSPAVRRVSAEILGHLSTPQANDCLVRALADEDSTVRASAVEGLARLKATSALLEIVSRLDDPEPDVRLKAVEALGQLVPYPRGIVAHLEPLLSDIDPLVRARTALILVRLQGSSNARNMLHDMACDANPEVRVQALKALGECGGPEAYELVVHALADELPVVRKSAAMALVSLQPQQAFQHLIPLLNEEDPSTQRTYAEALSRVGSVAVDPLIKALGNPEFEEGALMALELLPARSPPGEIRAYVKGATNAALYYHRLASGIAHKFASNGSYNERFELLVESLLERSQHGGLNALRAVGLLNSRSAIAIAIENLRSRESAQRANALETLETIGERELIRPLLPLWETGESNHLPLPGSWLADLLHDPSSWLRACAVLVADQFEAPEIWAFLQELAQSDPDSLVREAAHKAITGEQNMNTLTTLSLMERIIFLRRVPIFAGLPPADLKQVAAIMGEAVFADGELLAQQGEMGDEMYIVVSGEVSVMVTSESQNEPLEVARRSTGEYVGEMAMISKEPRFATLVADGTVRTLFLGQKEFEGILRERPEISLAVMRVLCQRLKEATHGTLN